MPERKNYKRDRGRNLVYKSDEGYAYLRKSGGAAYFCPYSAVLPEFSFYPSVQCGDHCPLFEVLVPDDGDKTQARVHLHCCNAEFDVLRTEAEGTNLEEPDDGNVVKDDDFQ